MKYTILLLFMASAIGVVAQDTTAVLLAKETAMITAVCTGDKPAAERLFAPDYITINADGTLQSREQTMAAFGKFKGSTFELSDKQVRLYGHTAVITGKARFHVKGILAAVVFYTEIWADEGNGWQFAGWQGTMTGLPSWYPMIGTALLLVALFFLVRWVRRKI